MPRNPISDLEAVAAMPGLEELADRMAARDPVARRTAGDHVSMLTLLAGRWAFGSLRMASAAMCDGGVWARMRASAIRQGRLLPEAPPTEDQLDAFRRRIVGTGEGALGELATDLADRFTHVAVPLVQSAGLLVPSEPRWHAPSRANMVYGDGSAFDKLTDVAVDVDGNVVGSRARATSGAGRRGPRLAPSYVDKAGIPSLPVTTIGVHGGARNQRGMVAIRMYFDGREAAASLDAIAQVAALAGGGVHGVIYDSLLSGHDLQQLMRWGLLPFVRMKEAQKSWPHLTLPVGLRERTYNTGRKKEQRLGKGKDKQHKDHRAYRKTRVRCQDVDVVSEMLGHTRCEHVIWAIDGCLVATDLGQAATIDSRLLRQVSLRRVVEPDGSYGFRAVYQLPCPNHHPPFEFDHTGLRPGSSQGRRNVMVEWVRPVPEADPRTYRILGWRQDAESTFATIKRKMHLDGRSGSLNPYNFLIDMVAAGMLINAVLWDEHVAHHTPAARS